ncbi:hypothetical protein [Phytohabitans aurantiacus]|uniref:Uncharacterized protein n=1 Tax=Phytohabitans aurantiacus TaxID=3016789 RepID=A0ABQ5QWZ4_9ACTN|nr:hypothetical protein [Phytohabitans aurantiacus]GLH98810.1 hypothetical protein Pa4123_40850 [Phytohabitans aurantiacus]
MHPPGPGNHTPDDPPDEIVDRINDVIRTMGADTPPTRSVPAEPTSTASPVTAEFVRQASPAPPLTPVVGQPTDKAAASNEAAAPTVSPPETGMEATEAQEPGDRKSPPAQGSGEGSTLRFVTDLSAITTDDDAADADNRYDAVIAQDCDIPDLPDLPPADAEVDRQPHTEPVNFSDRSSEDDRKIPDGHPDADIDDKPLVADVKPPDAPEPSRDQRRPSVDGPSVPPHHRAGAPSILDAAREHMRGDDREFIKEQFEKLVASADEKDRQDAAKRIRIRVATVLANTIASDITERNRWRAYREDPYAFLPDSLTDQDPAGGKKERRTFADRFVAAMEELIAVLVKEALIELAMPGVHLIMPPTGLFDAILTAGALLEAADHAR